MRLRELFRRNRAESEMDAELREHIALRADDLVKSGLTRKQAERTARVEFGSIESYKEACRESFGLRLYDELRAELRQAVRSLRRSPEFTAIAIVSLALGIGANTAMFSVVDAVALRPLPYAEPERLVTLDQEAPGGIDIRERIRIPRLDLVSPEVKVPAFEGIFGVSWNGHVLLGAAEPEQLWAGMSTANFTEVLGVRPVLGRWFTERERAERAQVAVISHDLWFRQFHGDRSIVGRAISLKGFRETLSFTVVGVLPRGFDFYFDGRAHEGDFVDIWTPLAGSNSNITIARLAPGASAATAAAQLRALQRAKFPQKHEGSGGMRIVVEPIADSVSGAHRVKLAVLFGAVGFVLLITCANLANLMLGRGASRVSDIAVRAALGAGRLRLCRQLLAESLLLAMGGGAAAILVAGAMLAAVRSQAAATLPRADQIAIDWNVLGFTMFASVLCGLLFGLVPALQLSRVDLTAAMKSSGRGAPGRQRTMRALVVLETAICLICVVGAGLMLNAFARLHAIDLGFRSDRVVAVELPWHVPQPERLRLFAEVTERVRALPGVEHAATSDYPPLFGGSTQLNYFPPGGPSEVYADYRSVGADYFGLMGIPIVRGRSFTDADLNGSKVAIVSESLARRHWNGNPVGRHIVLSGRTPDREPVEIVGVAADVRQIALTQAPADLLYVPYTQAPMPGQTFLLARVSVDPRGFAQPIGRVLRSLDKELPLPEVKPMEQYVGRHFAAARFSVTVLGSFGILAPVMAALGVGGLTLYSVNRRLQEVGLRRAVGATRWNLLAMFLVSSARLLLPGLVAGVAGAYHLTRYLESQLYEVTPTDPATFVAAVAVLALVAMAASGVAAYRSTTVDPATVLRCD